MAKEFKDHTEKTFHKNLPNHLMSNSAFTSVLTVNHHFTNKNKLRSIEYDKSYFTQQLQTGKYIKLADDAHLIQ